MPLESLSNDQINIHDLTLEQEKQPIPEWKKQYENLKETPLYDRENNQWIEWMSKTQEIHVGNRSSFDQLLDIAVKSIFDKSKSEKEFRNLKQDLFYDQEKARWHRVVYGGQTILKDAANESSPQLLEVYIESLFNPGKARTVFEELNETSFYNKETEFWNESIKSDQIQSDHVLARNQLLSVLCETQFDKQEALKHYDKLRKLKGLYDSKGRWHYYMKPDRFPICDTIDTTSQLLGVLVENQFDKVNAKSLYQEIKDSPLYDKHTKIWEDLTSDPLVINPTLPDTIRTADQLLGILCEHEFEEPTSDLQTQTPSLPETRSY